MALLPLVSWGTATKVVLVAAVLGGGSVAAWQLRQSEPQGVQPAAVVTTAPVQTPDAPQVGRGAASHPPATVADEGSASAEGAEREPARPAMRVTSAPEEPPNERAESGAELPVGVGSLPGTSAAFEPLESARSETTTAESSRLLEESALITAARASLRQGALGVAARQLEEHRRRFPSGRLAQERQALHIELLWRSGQTAAAQAELTTYARAYPGSPHTSRLLQLVGGEHGSSIGK